MTFVVIVPQFNGMSLTQFSARFPDDAACWAHLEKMRWPQGPVCPKCGSVDDAHHVGRIHYWRFNACRPYAGRLGIRTAVRCWPMKREIWQREFMSNDHGSQ